MKKDESAGTGSAMIPRRQFLVLGSAAVVGAAATSLSADIVRTTLVPEETASRLSAGFVPVALADVQAPGFTSRTLTPASHLRAGEAALDGGVRVKVHGIVHAEGTAMKPVSMALDVMYQVVGASEPVPFMAWSYARSAERKSAGAAPFIVPVGEKVPLSLSVATSTAIAVNSNAKLQAKVDLSLGSRRLASKLRSGLYFLAMSPAGTRIPDWSSIRVVASEGALPVLKRATLLGLEPVSFDYVVVSTDRA